MLLTCFLLGEHLADRKAVPVGFLPPSWEHHGGREEGDAVDIGEENGEAGVQGEEFHRAELRDSADTERQDVGQGGNGDRESRVLAGRKRNIVIHFSIYLINCLYC